MADRFIKVLLIEDNPGDACLIEDMLATAKGARFHLESVDRLAKGIERLGAAGIDVVLLDLSLPDSDGLDTFLRVQSRTLAVPIVILTSLDDEETALRAVREGAQDYISKNGLVSELLVCSISYAIERKRFENQLRDATEKKRAEEALRNCEEAIGRLAGGVAHDFNNILTVIQTSTFFAKNSVAPDHPLQTNLREIEMAGKRAGDLTRQLLAFARRQVIAPRNVDLNELILELEKTLRRLIGEDVELMTVTAPDLGLVRVDPGQMEQVLINLSVNARDAMPQGGRLIIETSRVSLSAEEARRYSLPTFGDYVLLTVRDNGCGMSAEVKARVFEPFFTTKELGKGTGLGLATCYGIVAQSGGQITAESEPGLGATFQIYLPRFEGAAEGLPRANGNGVLPRGSETVLLVEDEAAVRNLVARLLRESGYTVLEAANGYEALRTAKLRSETPIRLLVSDVVMPEIGGIQTADQLRAVMPEVRVLFMSGYTDSAVIYYTERNEGTAFLQKPFTPEALAHKVREVLDDGGAMVNPRGDI